MNFGTGKLVDKKLKQKAMKGGANNEKKVVKKSDLLHQQLINFLGDKKLS